MCSIYVHADPMQYESRTRSIRIDNVVTTIRLENQFWDVLAEMAEKEGQTTNQLVSTLHGELFALREDTPNFASFLRVSCLRYRCSRRAKWRIPTPTSARCQRCRPRHRGAIERLAGAGCPPRCSGSVHGLARCAGGATLEPLSAANNIAFRA